MTKEQVGEELRRETPVFFYFYTVKKEILLC